MKIECLNTNEPNIAVVSGEDTIILDTQSALDFIMTVQYETNVAKIVLPKKLICDDFFVLSTGLAGEILQKFVNYHVQVAVYGDYSHYTSKPLKDFIYESNQGTQFFFVETKEEAIQKLTETQ